MSYTQTQLDTIREFGDKTLSFGCIVMGERVSKIIAIDYERAGFYRMIDDGENIFTGVFESEYEILGHEPHLEDVFRVAEEKFLENDICILKDELRLVIYSDKKIIRHVEIQYNPTLPLLSQSEETLQQLISLFE